VLLTRRRERGERGVRIGQHTFPFNKQATRWLGVWLGSHLTKELHRNVRMKKAREAQGRLRRHGVPVSLLCPSQAPCCQCLIVDVDDADEASWETSPVMSSTCVWSSSGDGWGRRWWLVYLELSDGSWREGGMVVVFIFHSTFFTLLYNAELL